MSTWANSPLARCRGSYVVDPSDRATGLPFDAYGFLGCAPRPTFISAQHSPLTASRVTAYVPAAPSSAESCSTFAAAFGPQHAELRIRAMQVSGGDWSRRSSKHAISGSARGLGAPFAHPGRQSTAFLHHVWRLFSAFVHK